MEAGPPAHNEEPPTVDNNTNAPLQTTQINSSDQQRDTISTSSEQSSLANVSLQTHAEGGGGQPQNLLHQTSHLPAHPSSDSVNSYPPITEQKVSDPESAERVLSPPDVQPSSNSDDRIESTPPLTDVSVPNSDPADDTPSTIPAQHDHSTKQDQFDPNLSAVVEESGSLSNSSMTPSGALPNQSAPVDDDSTMGDFLPSTSDEHSIALHREPHTTSREDLGDNAAQPSAEHQKAEQASSSGDVNEECKSSMGTGDNDMPETPAAMKPAETHLSGLATGQAKPEALDQKIAEDPAETPNALTEAIKRDPGTPENPISIKPWEAAEEIQAKPAPPASSKRKKRTRASDVGASETPRKKGKSLESNSPGPSTPLVTVDTKCLPPWWIDPILYFSREKPYDNSKRTTSRVWVTRPDPRVCVGAAWLKPNCTGSTAQFEHHPEGPTQILRELTALVQSELDKPSVFDSNYTTFTRANFRMQVDPSRFETPFVSSIMLKLNTDREMISFVPADILLGAIVAHAEAFVEHSGLFPNFWAANELTLFQKAPTIAYSLLKVLHHPPINICEFIATLYPGLPSIDVFRELALSCRGNASTPVRTSRRRAEPVTNPSFKLDQNQLEVVKGILADLKRRLNTPFSSNLPVKQPQDLVASKTWKAGESLTPDGCLCTILTRYGAAIRFSIYEKYGIQPFILAYDTMTPLENIRALLIESTNWLASEPKTYLDFTLAANQTSFIMSLDRLAKEDIDLPIAEDAEPRALITSLLTQNTLRAQSHPTGNLTLKITEPPEWNAKRNEQNVTLHASLIASCEIPKDAPLTLAARSPITWAELARDDEEENNNDEGSGNDTITDDDDNTAGPSE